MHPLLGSGLRAEGRMMDARQLDCAHSALAEDLVQTPRILAMWHLHILWFWAAVLALPAVATIPEGDRVGTQEAKRPGRQGALSLLTEFEQTTLPINVTTPLLGGNREEIHLVDSVCLATDWASAEDGRRQWWTKHVTQPCEETGLAAEHAGEEEDRACLMQQRLAAEPMEGPWYELLEELRIKVRRVWERWLQLGANGWTYCTLDITFGGYA